MYSVEDDAKHVLDAGALLLYFPSPHTSTGETVLELHTHGSPAIVRAVLAAISRCSTPSLPVRPAEPGEFTRRAFLNDRLSLPQVEALGNTLAAVTEEQRRLSVQSTSGALAHRYESWRGMLLAARGELEALIDFSEDQHFDEGPATLAASVAVQVRRLVKAIELSSRNAVRGELLRNGIAISLIGLPNVGKSSILNQIVGRNAAIVSKEAGTTRDVVEVGLDLGGFFCRLGDTAGLRQTAAVRHGPSAAMSSEKRDEVIGEIEQEGMRRARAQALQSDVVILVLSIEPSIDGEGVQLHLDPSILITARELLDLGKTLVVAINKIDLYHAEEAATLLPQLRTNVARALPGVAERDVVCISVRDVQDSAQATVPTATGTAAVNDPGGFQNFLTNLTRTFRALTAALRPDAAGAGAESSATITSSATIQSSTSRADHQTAAKAAAASDADEEPDASIWQASLGATERQRVLLDTCLSHLRQFLAWVEQPSHIEDEQETEIDIVAASESLRSAGAALARITGRSSEAGDVEEVLGVVFEKYVHYPFLPLSTPPGSCFPRFCGSVQCGHELTRRIDSRGTVRRFGVAWYGTRLTRGLPWLTGFAWASRWFVQPIKQDT